MELIVKQGYKQTEVGLIPEDWNVLTINDVATVIGGGTPSTFVSEYWNGNINWFTPTEIGKNKYSYQSKRKITSLGLSNSSAQILPIGTILMSTRASIGDLSILLNEATTNQGFQSLIAKNDFYNEFLYYLIQNNKSKLIKNSSGSTFLEISPNKVKSIEIPIPPTLEEQKAIATALSDVDELISNLDKLITKKKSLKQGAIQQLLTPPHKGGKRLEGFTGDWVEKKMGECLKYEQPTKYIVKNANYEGQSQTPVLTAGKTFLLGFTDEKEGIYSDLPVIIFDDFTTSKQYVDFEFKVKSSAMKMLKATSETDINFIYSTMNMINFSLGDDHKRRWIAEYSKITIFVPEIQEQKAISEILSDMDLEIEQLESKKAKCQNVKQGMMQELLTGKTRLV